MRIFQEETGEDPKRKRETRLEHVCFRDGVPVYQRLEINGKPTGVKASDPLPPPDEEWRKRAEKIREGRKTQIESCSNAWRPSFSHTSRRVSWKPPGNRDRHQANRTTTPLRAPQSCSKASADALGSTRKTLSGGDFKPRHSEISRSGRHDRAHQGRRQLRIKAKAVRQHLAPYHESRWEGSSR